MKQVFILLISFICISCNKEFKYYDLNQVIKSDYEFLKESNESVLFYQSQGELDRSILDNRKDIHVISVINVFQADSSIVIITHPKGGPLVDELISEETYGLWLIDLPSQIEVEFDLIDILDILSQAPEIELIDTKYVTLRRPCIEPIKDNLQYIFGNDDSGYMWFDSITGRIEYHEVY